MARAGDSKSARSVIDVAVTVPKAKDGEAAPELRAYAFDADNRLLGTADLDGGSGRVEHETVKGPVRVMVGPRIDNLSDGALRAELYRLDAHDEVFTKVDASAKVSFVLPPERILCWNWCTVVGTLSGRTVSGGLPLDLPVCGAEIEVYEVDSYPTIVGHLSDDVIERLRRLVRQPPPPWPPVGPWPPEEPGPRPGPGPDPAPFLSRTGGVGTASMARPLGALGAGPSVFEGSQVRTFAFSSPEPIDREAAGRALAEVAANPALRAASGSIASMRAELLLHEELIRNIFCILYPSLVTKRLVGTAVTDDCGRFRLTFYLGCTSDQPDLFFQAYRRLGWWRLPLLPDSPVACYTHWNYECGSEVQLHTTSPFAVHCPPCPPVIAGRYWVLAMAVGNTSLDKVHGTSPTLQATTTSSNLGLLEEDGILKPFGGDLRFRFEFDDLIRTDLGVDHYLVSWRKAGTANPWVPLTDAVYRHREHAGPNGLPVIDPILLGPAVLGGQQLFEIPPATPPGGGQWVLPDVVVDTTNAIFRAGFAPATGLPSAPGADNFEFKLELFNAAGARVDATALGIHFVLPTSTDLTTTILTAEASDLGLLTGDGALVFQLHIDNNVCVGANEPATLSGQVAPADCGVLDYTARSESMTLAFRASHPNGFAQYRFTVQRGAMNVYDSGPLPVDLAPGEETISRTVDQLLGACTTAGFAQELYVGALATDGWNRQGGYDKHPPALPFVLEPAP